MAVAVLIAATLFMGVSSDRVTAQPYELTWYTVDGGGAINATGGDYRASGTIGQPDPGKLTGGEYTVSGGFWVFGAAAPHPPTMADTTCTDDQGCKPGESCIGGFCGMHNNRYLSIIPPAAKAAGELGIEVTIVDGPCSGTVQYAGAMTDYPEKDPNRPLGWFTGSELQATPVYTDLSAAVDGIVHLYGAEIGPEKTYEVRMITAQGGSSDPLTIETAKWGDIVRPIAGLGRPRQPDFADIGALVDKFKGLAYLKAQTQLQPEIPDPTKAVDFKDIGKGVDAFKGIAYPYPCAP